jgi:FkbM family methyltransferase
VTRGRLDYADAEIYMRVTSKREKMRLHACRKEPWTIQWIERWIQAGEVLYDVGANVGAYSLIAAKAVGARVVAFEPGYANYGALCENVMLNGLSDSITPLPTGLAAHTRMSAFEYTDVQPGAAQHALVEVAPITTFTPIFRQPVMTHRLDDLIEQFDLPVPNHIKIDVDGAEMAVLDGARRTLDNPALRSVLIEVFVNQADDVVHELAAHGLHLHQKDERVNKAGQILVWYGIFNRASVADRAALE